MANLRLFGFPLFVVVAYPHLQFEVGGGAGIVVGHGVCYHKMAEAIAGEAGELGNEFGAVAGVDKALSFPFVEVFLEVINLLAATAEFFGE